jgi:predicted aminopeptidase
MIRKILRSGLLILLGVLGFYLPLIEYGIGQGLGQLGIIWNAKPVSYYMDDPQFPDSLKARLKIIEEVRHFAIDSLGLKDTDNYRTLYDQKGKEIMWVVTACEPFDLKAKMWSFPVVGSVPYKGYFREERAMSEGYALQKAGYDVSVRNPGGWSTLGWFTDPILSGMLMRSEGDLASLIIHEMVHSTLWVKDSVELNENLASFIADTAAYDFLAWKYGKDSREYKTYLYEDQDYRQYASYILRASKQLDSLYQTMSDIQPLEERRAAKKEMIRKIIANMDTLDLKLTDTPSKRFEKRQPNNAYFMAYRHYQSKQSRFKKELDDQFHGDLKRYVEYLSQKYPFL